MVFLNDSGGGDHWKDDSVRAQRQKCARIEFELDRLNEFKVQEDLNAFRNLIEKVTDMYVTPYCLKTL